MRVIRFRRVACRARLFIADGFLSDDDIAHALSLGARAEAADDPPVGKRDATGFSFEMPTPGDAVLEALRRRIAMALGYANAAGGTLRYRRYHAGEFHPPHGDAFRIGDADLVATAMMWLTDDVAGGETCFPAAEPAVALYPRRGRLAVWLNYRDDGMADPDSVHLARPVRGGDKITLTEFVYGMPPGLPAFAAGLRPEEAIDGACRGRDCDG